MLERLMRTGAARRCLQWSLVRKILLPAQGNGSVHKFIRYSMVSGVAIVISQVTILICAVLFHTSGIVANTIGSLAATPASYELNRKWAWGKSGKSHLWREVAPFWALTLLGFLASTGTVQLADNACRAHHVDGLPRALAIMGASLFAYGVVWIAKFVIFNHVVFANKAPQDAPASAATGEPETLVPEALIADRTAVAKPATAAVPVFDAPGRAR
jgi:putative flippase GtrA